MKIDCDTRVSVRLRHTECEGAKTNRKESYAECTQLVAMEDGIGLHIYREQFESEVVVIIIAYCS